MMGCPEEQRSRSFASHRSMIKEQSVVLGSGGVFMRIEIGDSDTTILESL
jgi:hypothetical protein